MKILITGGSGFIGSALIRLIINHSNHNVINVDKLTYASNKLNLSEIENSTRYFFEKVDICNKDKLTKLFRKHKPDAIMHLAAESHVDRSIDDPSFFINTNILGTFNLLEVSKEYYSELSVNKRSLFKFHHISTDEVYGDLGKSKNFFTENTSYNPSSPYSASKASSDHLVRSWNRTYSLPTVITNCSNNYGPYQHPEKLIPKTIINAVSGNRIPVYGAGDQIRDWLYVEDHAIALLKVLLESKSGETYNIGGNNEKKNIEVIKAICNILDKTKPPVKLKSYTSLIYHVKDRPGHDVRYAIDSSKISASTGWKPTNTFDEGIKKTVLWYLENQEWLNNFKNIKMAKR